MDQQTESDLRQRVRDLRIELLKTILELEEVRLLADQRVAAARHRSLDAWTRTYLASIGIEPVDGLFQPLDTSFDRVQVIGRFIEAVEATRHARTRCETLQRVLEI